MKFQLPLNNRESARLYWELAKRGAFCVGEKLVWRYQKLAEGEFLCLALLQSRYDPTLLAVLIDYFTHESRDLHPISFKEILKKENALPVACMIGSFVQELTVDDRSKELFRYLALGTRPVPYQLFYRGLYRIGGMKMAESAARPLWHFKRWGFLAADPPLLKGRFTKRLFLFDRQSRLQILRELAGSQGQFRLRDYLVRVGNSVSRQQALCDIRSFPKIRRLGKGKGTFYRL